MSDPIGTSPKANGVLKSVRDSPYRGTKEGRDRAPERTSDWTRYAAMNPNCKTPAQFEADLAKATDATGKAKCSGCGHTEHSGRCGVLVEYVNVVKGCRCLRPVVADAPPEVR